MKIHVLTEDTANKRGMLAEHGMSLFIEHSGVNILFDTGQSFVFRSNAEVLGIDLQKTDCIVLSHGHYDHCGGLIHFPGEGTFPKVYAHSKAFQKKYKGNMLEKGFSELGIPWELEDHPVIAKNLIYNEKNLDLYPGMRLIAEIPLSTDFEDISRSFFVKNAEGMVNDTFADEQMLVIETAKGLVVFLGCSHPGVISCLKHVRKLYPDQPVYALVAGMHMGGASPLRVEKTIGLFLEYKIEKIIPLHCTGILTAVQMKSILKDRCNLLAAGDELIL